jgi:hypothetical protein
MSGALDALLLVAAIFAGIAGFVGFWMLVCMLLGLMSGWRGLASRYGARGDEPSHAQTVWGMVGMVSYNGVLHLAATHVGLDMRVMPLFRAGHPPLLVPWAAIRVEDTKAGLLGTHTKVRLGEGGPLLRVPSEVWKQLESGR